MLTCIDCAIEFTRPGSRGTIPKYCARCVKRRRAESATRNRVANPRPRLDPKRTVLCRDCGAPFIGIPPGSGNNRPRQRCDTCWKPHDFAIRAARYDRRRATRHGITEERLAAILEAQNGVCAVRGCGAADDGAGRSLHIDHDHSCCPGQYSCGRCVRGLLCARHNVGIGMFNNDVDDLASAVRYLRATAQLALPIDLPA